MDIRGKVAWITGGKRVGQVVAEALARRGAHIAASYRGSRAEAEETVRRAEALGVKGLAVRADVSKEHDVRAAVEAIRDALGGIHILVNMASAYAPPAGLPDGALWDFHLDANLRSAYLCSTHAAPLMRQAGGGRIVNFSDWASLGHPYGGRGMVEYHTAKAGVAALTLAHARAFAPEVLVNAVAPGPILPPPGYTQKEIEAVEKLTPLRRWGGAEEIAKAVLFLVETDFVTGEVLRVDGGRHLA
ncbi:MAG TPA: SDR family oxidoreductase [Candidatus Sulfotelmatobacter sp.]|nr:SDR family oxidoreductase [Candidatus Sulfotelmatobacter sp.]